MEWMELREVLGLLGAAAGLGAVLGLEREIARKPAGLRTHILVCVASAMFVLLALELVDDFRDVAAGSVRSDPIRVIQAIVIGISFLGAGTIVRDPAEDRVDGLTTAASILVTAAVGIAVALHQLALAAVVALAVAVGIFTLGWLEDLARGRSRDRDAEPPS